MFTFPYLTSLHLPNISVHGCRSLAWPRSLSQQESPPLLLLLSATHLLSYPMYIACSGGWRSGRKRINYNHIIWPAINCGFKFPHQVLPKANGILLLYGIAKCLIPETLHLNILPPVELRSSQQKELKFLTNTKYSAGWPKTSLRKKPCTATILTVLTFHGTMELA